MPKNYAVWFLIMLAVLLTVTILVTQRTNKRRANAFSWCDEMGKDSLGGVLIESADGRFICIQDAIEYDEGDK